VSVPRECHEHVGADKQQNCIKSSHIVSKLPAKLVKISQIRKKNEEKCTFFAFFCEIIWSIQKKAVPLHPVLKNAP
jgi:hypothetical protein